MDKSELIIFGTCIGTHRGWDLQDTFVTLFYDFDPNEVGRSLGMIAGDLLIDYELGWNQDFSSTQWNRLHLTKVEN